MLDDKQHENIIFYFSSLSFHVMLLFWQRAFAFCVVEQSKKTYRATLSALCYMWKPKDRINIHYGRFRPQVFLFFIVIVVIIHGCENRGWCWSTCALTSYASGFFRLFRPFREKIVYFLFINSKSLLSLREKFIAQAAGGGGVKIIYWIGS